MLDFGHFHEKRYFVEETVVVKLLTVLSRQCLVRIFRRLLRRLFHRFQSHINE